MPLRNMVLPAPGFRPERLVQLMKAAVQRCDLDLRGATVLTEAATGAYLVTPVLAALAGAEEVHAMTRETLYGTVANVTAQTLHLARLAGVEGKISVITEKTSDILRKADIVTNSGHLRPITASDIGHLKPGAVIPLMYEGWEIRSTDVDLAACRSRGIAFAGTNERLPAVGVFAYLGSMAVRQLSDAGIPALGVDILLLCNNPFGPYLAAGLTGAGARVRSVASLEGDPGPVDAVFVSLSPQADPVIGQREAAILAKTRPLVVQYWGDIDREALEAARIPFWPHQAPKAGHMGILPSAVGPDAIVRLQSGGLKVAEVLRGGGIKGKEFLDVL